MTVKETEGLDTVLFGSGRELVDIKCFRGDREDVTGADIKGQIHSALMQKRMNRATISDSPPHSGVTKVNVREFVAGLAAA